MKTFKLEIITPERVVYSDDVWEVVVPGSEGELGILPGHISLFTKIKPGEIMIRKGIEVAYLAVTGGFLDVLPEKVTILADYAVRSEEIEISQAQEAKRRAEEVMRERHSGQDFVVAESQLRRAMLELKIARHRKVSMTRPGETTP